MGTPQPRRLAAGGAIDRSRPVAFTVLFAGVPMMTDSTAVITNIVTLTTLMTVISFSPANVSVLSLAMLMAWSLTRASSMR